MVRTRKAKKVNADFKHRKAKVGGRKLPALNSTKTSFQFRTLRVAAGAEHDDTPETGTVPSSVGSISFSQCMGNLKHHNVNIRRGALQQLTSLFQHSAASLRLHLSDVLSALGTRLTDTESTVRSATLDCLIAALEAVQGASLAPHLPVLVAYLASGMTKLHASQRLDTLAALLAVLARVPHLMQAHVATLAPLLIQQLAAESTTVVVGSHVPALAPPQLALATDAARAAQTAAKTSASKVGSHGPAGSSNVRGKSLLGGVKRQREKEAAPAPTHAAKRSAVADAAEGVAAALGEGAPGDSGAGQGSAAAAYKQRGKLTSIECRLAFAAALTQLLNTLQQSETGAQSQPAPSAHTPIVLHLDAEQAQATAVQRAWVPAHSAEGGPISAAPGARRKLDLPLPSVLHGLKALVAMWKECCAFSTGALGGDAGTSKASGAVAAAMGGAQDAPSVTLHPIALQRCKAVAAALSALLRHCPAAGATEPSAMYAPPDAAWVAQHGLPQDDGRFKAPVTGKVLPPPPHVPAWATPAALSLQLPPARQVVVSAVGGALGRVFPVPQPSIGSSSAAAGVARLVTELNVAVATCLLHLSPPTHVQAAVAAATTPSPEELLRWDEVAAAAFVAGLKLPEQGTYPAVASLAAAQDVLGITLPARDVRRLEGMRQEAQEKAQAVHHWAARRLKRVRSTLHERYTWAPAVLGWVLHALRRAAGVQGEGGDAADTAAQVQSRAALPLAHGASSTRDAFESEMEAQVADGKRKVGAGRGLLACSCAALGVADGITAGEVLALLTQLGTVPGLARQDAAWLLERLLALAKDSRPWLLHHLAPAVPRALWRLRGHLHGGESTDAARLARGLVAALSLWARQTPQPAAVARVLAESTPLFATVKRAAGGVALLLGPAVQLPRDTLAQLVGALVMCGAQPQATPNAKLLRGLAWAARNANTPTAARQELLHGLTLLGQAAGCSPAEVSAWVVCGAGAGGEDASPLQATAGEDAAWEWLLPPALPTLCARALAPATVPAHQHAALAAGVGQAVAQLLGGVHEKDAEQAQAAAQLVWPAVATAAQRLSCGVSGLGGVLESAVAPVLVQLAPAVGDEAPATPVALPPPHAELFPSAVSAANALVQGDASALCAALHCAAQQSARGAVPAPFVQWVYAAGTAPAPGAVWLHADVLQHLQRLHAAITSHGQGPEAAAQAAKVAAAAQAVERGLATDL